MNWCDFYLITNYKHTYSEKYGWSVSDEFKQHSYGKGSTKTDDNTLRILMLGDSVTYGFPFTPEKSFSNVLDAKCDELEVINMGVNGYGTDQQLILLEEEGFGYHPDLVILNCIVHLHLS